MKRKRYKLKTRDPIAIMWIVSFFTIIGLTIAFSSYQSAGVIRDIGATVRAQANIRVTGVMASNPSNGAVSNYEEYSEASITSGLNLPKSNSQITYEVEVTNFGNIEMKIANITGLPNNLKYTLSDQNYKLNQMICDDNDNTKCTLGAKKTINITISYASGGYDSTTTTYPITLNFDFQPFEKVASINGIYYETLQQAINAVPKNNTQTTVKLLKNTSEAITVAKNQNIIFDFQNSVLSNAGNTNVISNNGTIEITNGIISSSAATNGAINNNSTGKITISGGSIIVTGGRQALYNDKGIAEITGTAYLSSEATERAAVQNQATGTLTITGGTIVSTGSSAVDNRGNMTIGIEDGDVDESSPIMQGNIYGITSTTDYNFYNGTAKGKTRGINNDAKVVDKEDGYSIASSDEVINGQTYQISFLGITRTVTFNPNGGTLATADRTKNVPVGHKVGTLPTPTRAGYDFDGWYTAASGGEQIGSNRIITEDIPFYAHWTKIADIARIGSTLYASITDALAAAPANTQTTITLLKNTSEMINVAATKNIILDLNNKTLSNDGNKAIVENYGTLSIINGTISSNADVGAVNNRSGNLTISSDEIIATGTRQAIYIYTGTVEITGSAYLSSNTSGEFGGMDRATIQCESAGTLKVTGGTIVGNNQHAISSAGTLTIGVKDGNIDATSPILMGKINGIKSTGTFNFYDGIIKGKTAAINGTVSDQEDNSQITNGTETIDGSTYHTVTVEEAS